MRLPPAILGNAEEVLREILRFMSPADVTLSRYFKDHPRLGGRERGAIAECVYSVLRNKTFYTDFAGGATMRRLVLLGMADAIGALSRVDHVAAGLADFGRADGWVERQVGRWKKQLESYSDLAGYPGPDIPGVDAVGEWLDQHRPSDVRIGLMHGDFHFANVLVRRDRPTLAAMVDWELATLGDPLLDLGHLLATWPVQNAAAVGV